MQAQSLLKRGLVCTLSKSGLFGALVSVSCCTVISEVSRWRQETYTTGACCPGWWLLARHVKPNSSVSPVTSLLPFVTHAEGVSLLFSPLLRPEEKRKTAVQRWNAFSENFSTAVWQDFFQPVEPLGCGWLLGRAEQRACWHEVRRGPLRGACAL